MIDEEKSTIKAKMPIRSKDYDFIAVGMDSKASNSNIKLKTAEEMAMELLLERVYKLEKKVLELQNKF